MPVLIVCAVRKLNQVKNRILAAIAVPDQPAEKRNPYNSLSPAMKPYVDISMNKLRLFNMKSRL